MAKQCKNRIYATAVLCLSYLEVALCYGNAGQQHAPLNQFANAQSFPSVANLPLANSYSVYRGQNIVRSPVAQTFPTASVPQQFYGASSPYLGQGQLINNYATGPVGTPVQNVWTPNRIPNAPIYQQSSIQPALTSYPQAVQSNAQLVQYSGIGSSIRQNNGLLLRPTNLHQQTINPANSQFLPGNYAAQNRQPIVNQLGLNANYIKNPAQQQVVNSPYSTQLPVYQTSNPLQYLRNSNTLRSTPSLVQQAQLAQLAQQQAQFKQLQLQQLQLQQSLRNIILQQHQQRGTLNFRPSPQLPSSFVLDGSQSLVGSTFIPVNTNFNTGDSGAVLNAQEWVPVGEDEEVKSTEAVKSLPSIKNEDVTLTDAVKSLPKSKNEESKSKNTSKSAPSEKKKPKGKAIDVQAEPEVTTSAPKTSTKKAITTTTSKPVETTKPTTATTTKKPDVEPVAIVEEVPVSNLTSNSDQVEIKEPAVDATASVASEPLVLAVAEPAFLELVKEISDTSKESV